jgi:hypothetical protein
MIKPGRLPNETVNRIEKPGGLAPHFIEDHERGNKFAVNILGGSVEFRLAFLAVTMINPSE